MKATISVPVEATVSLKTELAYLGRHAIAEFYDCDATQLNKPESLEIIFREAAEAAGATILSSHFHHFHPHGVSGIVVIAESHLAIHSWPEYRYASIDVYTCGAVIDPAVAIEHISSKLCPQRMTSQLFFRGQKKEIGISGELKHKKEE